MLLPQGRQHLYKSNKLSIRGGRGGGRRRIDPRFSRLSPSSPRLILPEAFSFLHNFISPSDTDTIKRLFGHIQLAINKNKYSQRNHRFNARTAQVFAASYATIKISTERVLVFHRAPDENID